ncbi:MAG: tetratricopeptide repeat protein [Porticoccaceae bacterium]
MKYLEAVEAGRKLVALGKFKKAIQYFKAAAEINSQNEWAYFEWGIALGCLGDHREAIIKYDQAVKIMPNFAAAYCNWGISLQYLGCYEEAVDQFKNAIEIDPDNANLYNNHGLALYELNRYEEAVEQFKKAIEIDPENADLYNNHSLALYKLSCYEEAIKQVKKAIKINPKDAEFYFNHGLALSALSNYEAAIEQFKKAIENNPKDESAYFCLGNSLLNLDKYTDASHQYKRATEIEPQFAEAYGNWGNALFLSNKYKLATKKYRKAIILAFAKISNNYDYTRELFKFTAINKDTLSNLANKQVFFQNPSNFNDPLDSPLITQHEAQIPKPLRDLVLKVRVFSLARQHVRGKKPYSSILMWSHYADQHKGLCIGYKFKGDLFGKHSLCLGDINYTNTIRDDYWQSVESTIKSGFFQKYQSWRYEHESRIIWLPMKDNCNGCMEMSDGIEISSVTFGYKTSDSDIALVKQLLGDGIIFYRVRYSDSEKLNRSKI